MPGCRAHAATGQPPGLFEPENEVSERRQPIGEGGEVERAWSPTGAVTENKDLVRAAGAAGRRIYEQPSRTAGHVDEDRAGHDWSIPPTSGRSSKPGSFSAGSVSSGELFATLFTSVDTG